MIAQNIHSPKQNTPLDACLVQSARVQSELEACNFNLKTLNDISKDIYSSVETDAILKNFLLMCMGNFGVLAGFVQLVSVDRRKESHFAAVGFPEEDLDDLCACGKQCLAPGKQADQGTGRLSVRCGPVARFGIENLFPFLVKPDYHGLLGLGTRLATDVYTTKEQELLETLINSLVLAIENAKAFEAVLNLNRDLEEKNMALGTALKNLRAEMKKVEILESVKDNLSKFVPVAVTNAIERSPTGHMPESRNQDLSVLFLDIEGYTRLCEKLGGSEVNTIIEKHFSVFMDAIHTNHGDVNETAGDGLMVLFLNQDKKTSALNAVRTALTIQKETARISENIFSLYKPLQINIGINSGEALVGAAKFDSITGSRWTYTARGSLTNIAARIGALASGGQTLLSKTTADHITDQIDLKNLGKFRLKNVKDKVDVYQLG